MNNVNLIGRTTSDIEVRYSQGKNAVAIANVSIAVENPFGKTDEASVDFIRLVSFGKTAEFMEKYIDKGTRIGVNGRIQTGSYDHKDGYTVYNTDVVVSNVYLADSKKEQEEHPKGKSKYSKPSTRR